MPRSRRALLPSLFVCAFIAAAASAQDRQATVADAWVAIERGDAAKAASIFRQELERRPTDPTLHYGAGCAAYVLGRIDAALASLKKAVELNPEYLEAQTGLAQVAYSSGNIDLAIRAMQKASALRPSDRRLAQQLERWRKESSVHEGMAERPGVRFNILYEGATQQAIGERVARVLESAYWRIGKALNSYPSETIPVILYTNRQFQDITRAPAWADGQYDGRIRVAVGGALRTPAALDRVVTHELVHAVVASAAPRNVPAWINEGLASHLESTNQSWAGAAIRAKGIVFPLDELANGFAGLDGESAIVAYAESAIAAGLLCELLGPNMGLLLQMMGNGDSLDQALTTLKVPPEKFHAEWERRVGLK